MDFQSFIRDASKISRIATVIIFLALIRCVSEPFRLQYYSTTPPTLEEIKPFLIGALVTSIALLTMTIFSYYGKHRIVIAICILTVVILLIVKGIYLIP